MKLFRILLIITIISGSLTVDARPIRPKKIKRLFRQSEVLKKHHVGFALYDLQTRKLVYGLQEDKFFTPASNTKLFTFYTGLKILHDSVPGLQYVEKGDSLIFYATGDPTLLHPDILDQPIVEKLKITSKRLFYSPGRYTGDFYGTGWAYDDYNEYYQPELAELPIKGNVVRFHAANGRISPNISPKYFKFTFDSLGNGGRASIQRDINGNEFRMPLQVPSTFNQEVPFKYTQELALSILSDTIQKSISTYHYSVGIGELKTWYSIKRDSLFKRMLLPSDNFIAEQLLLVYAAEKGLEMNAHAVIDYSQKNYLAGLPDKPQWVDGSGLSRQNLFTPRSMVKLCELIYDEFPGREAALFDLLPQGGKTGTLKNYFKADVPFLFAKTGSLSNNHNLTGYLVTKKSKRLAFSFMNNNFTSPPAVIRKEMERILTAIYASN